MKTFFKKHLAMSVTAPAFLLYIFLLPYKNDTNNVTRDKKNIYRNDPWLQKKNSPQANVNDKTYAVSWIFGTNTNQ